MLRYHFVRGRVDVGDPIRLRMVNTFGGGLLQIKAVTEGVMVAEANIESCELSAYDAILHLMGKVPKPEKPRITASEDERA